MEVYLGQMNDVQTSWSKNKFFLWQNVQANYALTFDKAMEEQFTHSICLNYQGKQNGSVVSTMYGVVGANTNSSYGKIYGPHSKYRLKPS